MTTLGFIGVGELARYTVEGLRRGGHADPIVLSPRNRDHAAWLEANRDCRVATSNQAVADASDIVILATRPAHCLEALLGLELRPGQLLLSVVAGVTVAELRGALNAEIDVVRAMPVSCATVGASPTLIYPRHDAVSALFERCGKAIAVDDERHFDQGTILACVYSWYFALFESLIEATGGPALPREIAAELVLGMARGAAELALARPAQTPGEIAAEIATAGTYSRLGLDRLESAQAFDAWRNACELLRERLDGG